VKEAAGNHKKIAFEGECGRFAPRHWQHSPLPCGAISQNSTIDLA
jgi:hypothetical protein